MIKIFGLYLLCVWLHHDVAVDEDGADDGEWEEWMSENMNGNPEQTETSDLGHNLGLNVLPSDRVKGW